MKFELGSRVISSGMMLLCPFEVVYGSSQPHTEVTIIAMSIWLNIVWKYKIVYLKQLAFLKWVIFQFLRCLKKWYFFTFSSYLF